MGGVEKKYSLFGSGVQFDFSRSSMITHSIHNPWDDSFKKKDAKAFENDY